MELAPTGRSTRRNTFTISSSGLEVSRFPAPASRSRSGAFFDVTQAHETEIIVRGAKPSSATMTVLTAQDIHAHNTFAQPDAVGLRAGEVRIAASSVVGTIPPAAVVCVQVELS